MATNQKMAENRITGYEKFGVISLHKVDRSSESPLSPFSMSFASSSIAENRFDQIKPEKRLVKKKTNNHILEFILVQRQNDVKPRFSKHVWGEYLQAKISPVSTARSFLFLSCVDFLLQRDPFGDFFGDDPFDDPFFAGPMRGRSRAVIR